MIDNNIIWITWEEQRRTEELARALGVSLYKILYNGNYFFKIIRNSFATLTLILSIKPKRIIIQNPSMVLATLVSFIKSFLGFKLVIDRHSNFRFHTSNSKLLKEIVFHYLSRYTIKRADLTIVTNNYLKEIVDKLGGDGFVLQDKMPNLNFGEHINLNGNSNVIFPCTYSHDEPYKEVIESAKFLPENIMIYITGNYKKIDQNIVKNATTNVIFTGFLDEKKYQSLLYSSDIVLALTMQDHTLLCSAYEGVAMQKPLILSNKKGLKEYFYKGIILTDNSPENISRAIFTVIKDYKNLKNQMKELSDELYNDWQIRFDKLGKTLSEI